MEEEKISNSTPLNGESNSGYSDASSESQVILNVYDLSSINHYSIWVGVGIFHSGIEGQEIFFFHFLSLWSDF